MKEDLISVVIPMYCEEKVVNECYKRLKNVFLNNEIKHEFIFVNDGSKDKTLELLKKIADIDLNVKIIDFSRNFGQQNAFLAGIESSKGDGIVLIDADLQDPPEVIPDMIKKWKEGYQVVYGKRKIRRGESKFKLLTSKYFYKFLNLLSDVRIPKDTGDFRLIDRSVVKILKIMPEKNKFLRGVVSWIGFNQTFIEYERDERFDGETKYTLKKMISLAGDGIISFSNKPLRLILTLGGLSLILFFISLIYVFFKVCILKVGIGIPLTIVLFLSLFLGIQLSCLGIIALYLSRIYEECKGRPNYVIKDKINM